MIRYKIANLPQDAQLRGCWGGWFFIPAEWQVNIATPTLFSSTMGWLWSQFRNFFCPAMKHLRTEVEGSRKKRVYDKPLTPFERLKACPGVDPKQIARLEKLKATLNPFKLKRSIERKLRRVHSLRARNAMEDAA